MIDLKDEGDILSAEIGPHSSSCSSSPIVSSQNDHIKINKVKRANTFNCVEPSTSDDSKCNFCSNDINDNNNLPSSQTDRIEHVPNTIFNENIGTECAALHHHHQLPFTRKFMEFYAAPITKFWTWTIAYFFFLAVYTYTLLVRTPPTPEWNECYVIVYIASFGMEKLREILASEPVNLNRKLLVWATGVWNCCDAFFIVEFFVGMILRNRENTLDHGRVLYCLNIVYWLVKFIF